MRMRNAPGRGDGIFVGRVGHAESSGASKQMKGEREYRVRSEVKPGEPAYARWRTDIRVDYRITPPLLRSELDRKSVV